MYFYSVVSMTQAKGKHLVLEHFCLSRLQSPEQREGQLRKSFLPIQNLCYRQTAIVPLHGTLKILGTQRPLAKLQ